MCSYPSMLQSQSDSRAATTLDDLMATLGKLEEGASLEQHREKEKTLAWRKPPSLKFSYLPQLKLS